MALEDCGNLTKCVMENPSYMFILFLWYNLPKMHVLVQVGVYIATQIAQKMALLIKHQVSFTPVHTYIEGYNKVIITLYTSLALKHTH